MIARKEQGTVSGDIASVKTRARLRIRSNKSTESLYAETVKGDCFSFITIADLYIVKLCFQTHFSSALDSLYVDS